MEPDRAARAPSLGALETVRCLECSAVYAKPRGGGTVQRNPGCPECGYVGWLSASVPLTAASVRLPRAWGLRPHLHVPLR